MIPTLGVHLDLACMYVSETSTSNKTTPAKICVSRNSLGVSDIGPMRCESFLKIMFMVVK